LSAYCDILKKDLWETERIITMNAKDNSDINSYLEQKPDHLRQIAVRLMEIILLSNPCMSGEIRWGKPTFGLSGDFHHWICAIQVMKDKVSLIFHFGGLLHDGNNRLIAGTSRFLRKLEYESIPSINEAEIKAFIEQVAEKLPYFRDNWKELNARWKKSDS
jgi:hypothetical protein